MLKSARLFHFPVDVVGRCHEVDEFGTRNPSSLRRHSPSISFVVSFEPSLEHDESLDRLAEDLVRHADDRGFLHAWNVHRRRVLDLFGRDLLAARLDDVVHPADEIEIAVFVEPAVVAGVEDLLAGQRTRA